MTSLSRASDCTWMEAEMEVDASALRLYEARGIGSELIAACTSVADDGTSRGRLWREDSGRKRHGHSDDRQSGR